jgi:hypothetical protein
MATETDFAATDIIAFTIEHVHADEVFQSRRAGRLFFVAVRGGAVDWAVYESVINDGQLDLPISALESETVKHGFKATKAEALRIFPCSPEAADLYRR